MTRDCPHCGHAGHFHDEGGCEFGFDAGAMCGCNVYATKRASPPPCCVAVRAAERERCAKAVGDMADGSVVHRVLVRDGRVWIDVDEAVAAIRADSEGR